MEGPAKAQKAKIRARSNRRVQTIKRLKSIVLLASPFKGESGIILEDQE